MRPHVFKPLRETTLQAHERVTRGRRGTLAVLLRTRHLSVEEVLRHRGHERARQNEREDHREDHGLCQRDEEKARNALEEEHRHERDADTQRRHECRGCDLMGPVEDGRLDLLALLQVPVDVLDRHGGIVNEDANRQREAAQGHDVEGLAHKRQRRDRAQNRKRDRRGDDQCRAPAAEEQEDHQTRQRSGDHPFADDTADRRRHEQRLVADRADGERFRQARFELRHLGLDALNDGERRGGSALFHGQQHRPSPADVHDIGLGRVAVANVRDIVQIDRRAVDDLDRKVGEPVDLGGGAVELHRVFEFADLLRTGGQDEILGRERERDVLSGQTPRLQRGRVQIDLHFARLAAVGPRHRSARHRDELSADEVHAEVGEHLLGQAFSRERELDDRDGGGVVVENQRRRSARGHQPEQRLGYGNDLRVRRANVGRRLKEDLDDPEARIGDGLDVLDVVHGRGERALERRHDATGHLVGRQPGVLPHNADHGDADIRKDVGRGAQRR